MSIFKPDTTTLEEHTLRMAKALEAIAHYLADVKDLSVATADLKAKTEELAKAIKNVSH